MKPILDFNVSAKYQLRLHDAETGKVLKTFPWVKNLIGDEGLNRMAGKGGGASPAAAFQFLGVGSSNTSTSTASGAVTFIQTATSAVSASAPFFTANMVGQILKYGIGSAGYEQYIATFIDSTHITVQASPGGFQTVVSVVGTVWAVNAINLIQFLYSSNTILAGTGNNGTTYTTATTEVMQRTLTIGVQTSAYTVNEVGWSDGGIIGPAPIAGVSQGPSTSNNVWGRTVVGSVNVGITNFLSVVIVLSVVYSPSVPTAVGNVNTNMAGGAMNTAGNAMVEYFAADYVDTNGVTQAGGNGQVLCSNFSGANMAMKLYTSNYSQQGTIFGSSLPPVAPASPGDTSPFGVACGPWTYVTATTPAGGTVPPGSSKFNFSATFTTAAQTVFGIMFRTGSAAVTGAFDVKLTAPFVLPTGSFPMTGTMTCTYSRTLIN